jgi:tRNA pseudouridine55 synthase
MDGVLSIHKPKGPTSHDIVARVRRAAGMRRVGHIGTLDPMAEGVLVCCLGRATRIVPYLVGLPKEYTGEILLGAESDTYDAEGRITEIADPSGITSEALESAMREQLGWIDQAAPSYSAIKVAGKKLYEYARENIEVPVKIRRVWIERFDLVRYLSPRLLFKARVGSGTYIRSMAHDLGRRLGCGAYLTALCRTYVGQFCLGDAMPFEALDEGPERVEESLLSIGEALSHLPKLTVTPEAEYRVRHGGFFSLADIFSCEGPQPIRVPTVVLSSRGDVLALAQAESEEEPYKPLCVLAGED